MKKLRRLWQAIEEPYGIVGVRAEWRRHLREEYSLGSAFLRNLREPSATYPCPRQGGDGCPRRVVIHGPDDIVAVCGCTPKECDTLKLKPEDIAAFEFDHRRFCGFLAESLGLAPVVEPVGAQGRTWQVGWLLVSATDRAPVFLVMASSRVSFDAAVGHLLARFQGPFTVLTPTLRFAGAAVTAGLQQRRAALLALEEVMIESGDGRLAATGKLADLLAPEAPNRTPEIAGGGGVFRREQDLWLLVFAGKSARLRHAKGFTYLAEVLRRPGRDLEALSLTGRPAGESDTIIASAGIEMADEKTLAAVRTELQVRKDELEAIPSKDWVRRGKLTEEIKKLEDYLSETAAVDGRARKVAGSTQRARTAVTNAISRAIKNIGKHHKDLAAHLKASIRTGETIIYLPDPPIDWEF